MVHANAKLAPAGRLELARCVVDQGWPLRRAAERFQVSHTTAKRWAERYRQSGAAGMADRSSRPHHSPARMSKRIERRIVNLRFTARLGPARIAIHIDIKKLGNIPDGGGHRAHGRAIGTRNSQRTDTGTRRTGGKPRLGHAYVHTVIDDHSRLAYTEILPDERKETATAFWQRAHRFFTDAGITVRRVLTDNGACYRSHPWRDQLAADGIAHKRTRPYRPQTNGKVERYHRTLLDEWAYARPYTSETERRAALTPWLHLYNHCESLGGWSGTGRSE
ncbi:IS481 family transposase [Actinomadura luteofluorescens]